MLLGGKSYDIAMRKLSYCKIIALPLPFCSIFPTPFIRLYIKYPLIVDYQYYILKTVEK